MLTRKQRVVSNREIEAAYGALIALLGDRIRAEIDRILDRAQFPDEWAAAPVGWFNDVSTKYLAVLFIREKGSEWSIEPYDLNRLAEWLLPAVAKQIEISNREAEESN